MSIVVGVGERGQRHEVSILIACGTGDARCWGCWPRRKVSMMRMGPPQQGQGCSGAFGCSERFLNIGRNIWALIPLLRPRP